MKRTKMLTHVWNKHEKGLQYNYVSRRLKKRERKAEWILKINSAARRLGITYSRFINKMKKEKIILNRKMLSEIITTEPLIIEALIKTFRI